MSQLNYHHLYYFYITAREGSIAKAAQCLHLTPQTVSGQLSIFENYLGFKLFDRKGKRLVLNETGKMTLSYAEDIFALGDELLHSLKTEGPGEQFIFAVGVTDVIPKILSFDFLRNSFEMNEAIRLICREGDFESLQADLALNKIDLILSDRPLTPGSNLKAYSHLLGESGISFYTSHTQANALQANFPYSLDQQAFLISSDKSSQKVSLSAWFNDLQIQPNIIAEFDDTALMKFFGQSAYGIFCTPTIIEQHVIKQYNVAVIGRTEDIKERYYAISPERKIKHPGVKFLLDASQDLFS